MDVLVFLLATAMAAVLLWAFIRLLLYDFNQAPVPAYPDPVDGPRGEPLLDPAWTPQQTEVLDKALRDART